MIIEQIVAKLASLDLSEFEAREADLNVERDRINDARLRSEGRTSELGAMLATLKADRMSGSAAADALLAGGDVSALAADENAIRAEMETLGLARRELSKRREAIQSELELLRSDSAIVVAAAIEGEVDELVSKVEQAATTLADAYGLAYMLKFAVRSSSASALEEKLRPSIVHLAMQGMVANHLVLPRNALDALEHSAARAKIYGSVPASPLRLIDLYQPPVATHVLSSARSAEPISSS